jgi:hypothetical protein
MRSVTSKAVPLVRATLRRTLWVALALGSIAACTGSGNEGRPPTGGEEAQGGAPEGGSPDASGGLGGASTDAGGATAGASTDAGGATAGAPPDGPDPYQAWSEIRDVVRQSPDHLERRADELVVEADAQRLFEFVRDAIITLPPNGTNYDNSVRWGSAETLRSGAGTPREKAELLCELYQRAGFEAELVGYTPTDPIAADAVFLRDVPRPFELLGVDLEGVDLWRQMLGEFAGTDAARPVDPDGTHAQALAEALLPLAEPLAQPKAFDFISETRLPAVRVTIAGERKIANPTLPSSTLSSNVAPASSLTKATMPTVVVRVHGKTQEGGDLTLVEGEWQSDALVGRELTLRFAPDLPLEKHLLSPFLAPRTFTPVLVLGGRDDSDEPVVEVATGTSLTEQGEVVTRTPAGVYAVNGRDAGDGSRSPELEAAASSLALRLNAGRFPRVTAEVEVFSSGGADVRGLSAASFLVEEDGVEVSARLYHNQPPPPRILMVVDRSGSIPPEFTGDNLVALATDLRTRLSATTPGVEYRVGIVDTGLRLAGDWTSDPAEVEAQLATSAIPDSTLWAALERATRAGPSVIVLISDGEATDAPSDEIRAAVDSGPPVIGIDVGSEASVDTVLGPAAELSGGLVTPVTTISQAVDAIAGFVGEVDPPTYTLSYTAPLDGPSQRRVTVSLRDTGVHAGAEYTVRALGVAHTLQGLYVTVKSGGRTVTRTLAGAPEWQRAAASAEQRAEVLGQFFGMATLSFEGMGPTLARAFDEELTARLSTEHIYAARNTHAALLEALAQGYLERSAELRLAQAYLPQAATSDSLTYPTSLRVALENQRPQFGEGIRRTIDLLPVTTWQTVHRDPQVAWRATLEKTLNLALAEAANADVSTFSLLDGRALVAVPHDRLVSTLRDRALSADRIQLWDEAAESWGASYDFLIPEAGDVPALWAVHRVSGAVYGVLPDGSGGGSSGCGLGDRFAATNATIALIMQLGMMAAPLDFAGGTMISLGVAVTQTILLEAAIISVLPPTSVSPEELENLVAQLQVSIDELGMVVPKAGAGAVPFLGQVLEASELENAVDDVVSLEKPFCLF